MEAKIQDLTDAQANEFCARAQEWEIGTLGGMSNGVKVFTSYWMSQPEHGKNKGLIKDYTPTTNPAKAFELQEVFKIEINCLSGDSYIATVVAKDGIRMPSVETFPMRASSLKRAIVNAVIASVYGDSIEIEGEG